MTFYLFGCSHRQAGVELRQRLALSPEETPVFLKSFAEQFPEADVCALSTCNRVEVYSWVDDEISSEFGMERTDVEQEKLTTAKQDVLQRQMEFFASYRGVDRETLFKNCFQYSDYEAVEHLLQVASSLDSMALGDVQIISQVRTAHDVAADAQTIGLPLNLAFQSAIKAAKRIDTETEIQRHRTSIASIAVKDFAKNIFEDFANKTTLVIGAGEMAEETLEYLIEDGANRIQVINRTFEKAQELAQKKGGTAVEWSQLESQVLAADLIIAAVGATEPILTAQTFQSLYSQRRRRGPLFILDLGVPRNIDPAIEKFPDVYLFTIDDLEQTCQQNRAARERQLPKAYAIIKQETDLFFQDLAHRRSAPILSRLRNDWESITAAELKRLFNKRPNLTEEDQQAIERTVQRLINKILNAPYQTLRSESKDGTPGILLNSIVKLFRLK